MLILITNIKNDLIKDAINLTQAEKTILILDKELLKSSLELEINTPCHVEYLNSLDPKETSARIRDIFKGALQKGEVELALEADTMGLQILESAKNYEIFKKKKIFVVNNGKIDKFKACLC
jgi:hypothetical protein